MATDPSDTTEVIEYNRYTISREILVGFADIIRSVLGTTQKYRPSEMLGKLRSATISIPRYTNYAWNGVDFSGNNVGKSWLYTGMRFNGSSGSPVAEASTNIVGLIPCKIGDTIRIRWTGSNDLSYQSFKFYDADKTEIAVGYNNFNGLANVATPITNMPSQGVLDFTLKQSSTTNNMAYMAVVLVETSIHNVIITVNQEIT